MRIALIGDSHSQVMFPLLRSLLSAQGHQVVFEQSQPGWTARRYTQSGLSGLAAAQPNAAIVSLGGNNSNLSASYGTDVQALLQQLRQAGVSHVLWIGPLKTDASRDPATSGRHDWTRAWLQRNSFGGGYRYLDPYPLTDLTGSRDGVHLTRGGYQRLVNGLWPAISLWLTLRQNILLLGLAGVGALGILGYVGYRLYVRRIDRKLLA